MLLFDSRYGRPGDICGTAPRIGCNVAPAAGADAAPVNNSAAASQPAAALRDRDPSSIGAQLARASGEVVSLLRIGSMGAPETIWPAGKPATFRGSVE